LLPACAQKISHFSLANINNNKAENESACPGNKLADSMKKMGLNGYTSGLYDDSLANFNIEVYLHNLIKYLPYI